MKARSAGRGHVWTRGESRRRRYPVVGAVLATGSPLGLFILRFALADVHPSGAWAYAEMRDLLPIYAYATLSTALAFIVLGWIIGRAEDRLAERATTDAFTALANRGHFNARATQEFERIRRYRMSLSLLIVDVDHLKEINDRGGHVAGDQAIRDVADSLSATCRSTDLPARYGGDEFAVLAPSTNGSEALLLAARIQQTLLARSGTVTVSIGISHGDASGPATCDALIREADAALYEAKSQGRNRAVLSCRAHSVVVSEASDASRDREAVGSRGHRSTAQ